MDGKLRMFFVVKSVVLDGKGSSYSNLSLDVCLYVLQIFPVGIVLPFQKGGHKCRIAHN